MQTSLYLILVIVGIVGPKVLSRTLRRSGSPLALAAYGAGFFVATYLLHVSLIQTPYGLEQAAVGVLCAAASCLLLFFESRARQ